MGSTKRIVKPFVLVNNQSLATSFQSAPFSIQYMDRASLEILITGTPTGNVTVQGSTDYIPPTESITPNVTPANWFDLPLTLPAISGGPQKIFGDIYESAIPWIRISWVAVSGAGNMTSVITAKES